MKSSKSSTIKRRKLKKTNVVEEKENIAIVELERGKDIDL